MIEILGSNMYKLLENSQSYYAIATDMEGKYIYANQHFIQKFSFLADGIIGLYSTELVHPDDVAKCEVAVMQCFMNPKAVVPIQMRKPDGFAGYFWTHWEFSAMTDAQGNLIGILCIGHDITEQERINSKVLEYAKRVKTILDNVTDGFYTLDSKWRFTGANKVFEVFCGKKRYELIGKVIWDIFPNSDKYEYAHKFREAAAVQEAIHFEEYYPSKKAWYSIMVYPSTEGLAVFFQDITQSKANEKELAVRTQALMDIAHLQSHDIRRPVATMLGLLQLIEKNDMSEENRSWFELFERTAKELDQVIHRIVDKVSQISS